MPADDRTQEIYAQIVARLTQEDGVSFPEFKPGAKRPFGSNALHVDGKIFCMIDRRGRFVVKIPHDDVQELMNQGRGMPFEMGKAKWTKEWVVLVPGTEESWMEWAYRAYEFGKKANYR